MAIVAAHLGVINEEEINNMSMVFFEDVLEQLGHRLRYEAIVNYAGNSFCEKSWDMINDSNPFNIANGNASGKTHTSDAFIEMLNKANIKVQKKEKKENGKD